MDNALNTNEGIRLLVQRCREEFRLPENADYYSENDCNKAERKFVKLCLRGKFKPSFHCKVDSK
jgi:hypothetical protein